MKARRSIYKLLAILLCLTMVVGMIPAVNLFPIAQASGTGGTCKESHSGDEWSDFNATYAGTAVSTTDNWKNIVAGKYYLTDDLELDHTIRTAAAVHLDLNGYSIKAKTGVTYKDGTLIKAMAGSNLIICDSSAAGTGTIDGLYDGTNTSTAASLSSLIFLNYGKVTLWGGTLTGLYTEASEGAPVKLSGTNSTYPALFTMEGGQITGNKVTNSYGAGGVYCGSNTSFTMNDGEISGNYGKTNSSGTCSGGGVALHGGASTTTFTMTGGTITGNHAYRGAGVGLRADSSNIAACYISGGEISGNTDYDASTGDNTGEGSQGIYARQANSKLYISGDPVIDGINFKGSESSIGNLLSGASITDSYQLTVTDNTVIRTGTAIYNNSYTYNPESGTTPPVPETTAPPVPETTAPPAPETTAPPEPEELPHEGWTPINGQISSLAAGDYVLTDTVTLSGTVTVSGDLNICLNGQKITGNANPYFNVTEGGTLTICDCAGTGMIGDVPTEENGTITYPHALGSGYIKVTDGTLKLYGGTITGNKAGVWGGAVQLSGAAEFYMYGGTITKNASAMWGGAISMSGTAAFEMNGGEISYNVNEQYNGGAILINSTVSVTINDGTIKYNKAPHGGAFGARNKAQSNITVNGGTISNNTATNQGGAFYVAGDLTINGGTITGNTAANGGAIYGVGIDLVMTGGTIEKNTTTKETSTDVVLDSSNTNTLDISGTAVIDEGAISGKVSDSLVHELEYGGCVYSTFALDYDQENDTSVAYAYDADSALHSYISTKAKTWCDDHDKTHKDYTEVNAEYLANSSFPTSGDVVLTGDVTLNSTVTVSDELHICLNGNQITGNANPYFSVGADATLIICDCVDTGVIGDVPTEENGTITYPHALNSGYINVIDGTLKLYGGTITGNKADVWGGAVQLKGAAEFYMYGGTITKNGTANYGGAISARGTSYFEMNGGTLSYNKNHHTTLNGGAICLDGTAGITINGGIIEHNEATNGGAIGCRNLNAYIVTVNGGTISNNSATESGGAFYFSGDLTMSGGEISGNTAASGGAIYGQGLDVIMTGGKIKDNTTTNETSADVVLDSAKTNTLDISGTAVVDQGAISGAATTKLIHDLTEGACVYSKLALGTNAGDTTVAVDTTSVEGMYIYTAKAPSNNGIYLDVTPTEGVEYVAAQDLLKAPVGTTLTTTLTPKAADGYTIDLGAATVTWESSDENVATVENGVVTYKQWGTAVITASVEGTEYYANINVQVGNDALKVLAIGNAMSRDTLYYLSALGIQTDNRVTVGYLHQDNATLRDLASNMMTKGTMSYYKSDASTGAMNYVTAYTITNALADEQWDYIILQQGVLTAGIDNTYNSDLEYLIDCIEASNPDAKLYWNMTWALKDGMTYTVKGANFSAYNKSQQIMYNAIVDRLDKWIVGNDAPYSSTNANNRGNGLGWGIDGYFFTGAAVQELRDTSAEPTRDGCHLSYVEGRLAAAMSVLKVLYPDVDLNSLAADNELIAAINALKEDASAADLNATSLGNVIAAVTDAAQDVSSNGVPTKLTVPAGDYTASVSNEYADVTVGKAEEPLKLYFPDVAVIGEDVFITAYESYSHNAFGSSAINKQVGGGRILVWKGAEDYTSAQWQARYNEPLLVVDDYQLQQWGVLPEGSTIYDRYEAMTTGKTCYVAADPRDANMISAQINMDADEELEDVLLLTFWVNYYQNVGNNTYQDYRCTYLAWSTDKGVSWDCQPISPQPGVGGEMKRGDMTVFSNGNILVPFYVTGGPTCQEFSFDSNTGKWVAVSPEYAIPNTVPEENNEKGSWAGGEMALVSPTGGNTVYALVRKSGAVLKSTDRGATWTMLYNEPGTIAQPNFVILDDDLVFATWHRHGTPIKEVSRLFYLDADWTDTEFVDVYLTASTNSNTSDRGDPGTAVLSGNRVFVVAYDTNYNSIVGMIEDPLRADFDQYKPIEVGQEADEGTLTVHESTNAALPYSLTEMVTGSHTVTAEVTFTAETGKVTIETAAGSVEVPYSNALTLNQPATVAVSVVGNYMYTRVTQGAYDSGWSQNKGTGNGTQTGISGTGAELVSFKVTRQFKLELQESLVAVIGNDPAQLTYSVMPGSNDISFASDAKTVATVDNTGLVTFVGEGQATITMTVGGQVKDTCIVTVNPLSAELTGRGDTVTILDDNFDGYTIGQNLVDNDTADRYTFRPGAQGSMVTIEKPEDSDNQYLHVNKTIWFMNTEAITGDYTVQFDIKFNDTRGQVLYTTLWQKDSDLSIPNDVWSMMWLGFDGYRYQYKPDATSDALNMPADASGKYDYLNGFADNNTTDWLSVKMVRTDGAVYLKTWLKGSAEPENWSFEFHHEVLDTDGAAHFRMSGGDNQFSCFVDNLKITQQVVEPTLDDNGKSLTLDGLTNINAYYTGEGMQVDENGVVTNAGVLVWNQDPESNDPTHDSGDPALKQLVQVETENGVEYKAVIDSMPAARYADSVYYRSYIQLADGSYEYGDLIEYSVKQYCDNMLGKAETAEELKTTLAAKLYYGSAAEKYFGTGAAEWVEDLLGTYDRTEVLDNKWDNSYLTPVTQATTEITATGNVTDYGKSLYLKDNVYVKFYFKSDVQLTDATVCFWKNVDGQLTLENSKQVAAQGGTALAGGGYEYYGVSDAIPAAELGDTVYACLIGANGEAFCCSGVIAYSAEQYASNMLNKTTTSDELKEVVKWMVIYGERAKAYFED